ncbi:MAG: MoaD/ThiS family protein [bacterium]
MSHHTKEITLSYFASLREKRGQSQETVSTCAETPRELYETLSEDHGFEIPTDSLRVAVNDTFKPWDSALESGDEVVFIPPVSGGDQCL